MTRYGLSLSTSHLCSEHGEQVRSTSISTSAWEDTGVVHGVGITHTTVVFTEIITVGGIPHTVGVTHGGVTHGGEAVIIHTTTIHTGDHRAIQAMLPIVRATATITTRATLHHIADRRGTPTAMSARRVRVASETQTLRAATVATRQQQRQPIATTTAPKPTHITATKTTQIAVRATLRPHRAEAHEAAEAMVAVRVAEVTAEAQAVAEEIARNVLR